MDIENTEVRALVLPGGGARAAYQVGVLKAIARLLPRAGANPFPIISGTSAGSINAAVLACRTADFVAGIEDLERVWANFRAEQVFKTDAWTMLRSSLHWLAALVSGGLLVPNPRSLLDNAPLRRLLGQEIDFARVDAAIERGELRALGITASGYTSARSVTFYRGIASLSPWSRVRRDGRPAGLDVEHLMASAAVPFVFPPVHIGGEYFGDGAMRQSRPLSPAIHLGAERMLVIGVRNEVPDEVSDLPQAAEFPSFGQIGGYMLDTLFMDGLYSDLEALNRINRLVEQAGSLAGPVGHLKRIDCLLIIPSQDIRDIAQRHAHELPKPVRLLLRGLGARNQSGRQLVSYLLFESAYTRELIELGYNDAMEAESHIQAFLRGTAMDSLDAPERVRKDLND